jgi:1-deoxy-D-xylulose-5-phosphate synthase
VGLLDSIDSPADLRQLSYPELTALASEIRGFLIRSVTRTTGHLGPNLGVVELTLALHRTFDSPHDPILWDTGHQAYVHKLVTGRRDGFAQLRKSGGMSGYPSSAESPHDVIENSHASTSLSYADGLAKAFQLRGISQNRVVAVIGDGALTGGMAWEALNNIAAADRPVIIVVNDNERSYSPTIGGLAAHLATLRTTRGYERFLDLAKSVLGRTPVVGGPLYDTLHGIKKGLKDVVAPQGMFEDLGLKYIGPVDGHDLEATERALRLAKGYNGPVLVHAITRKGLGYAPAENDDADRFHAVGVLDPNTGKPLSLAVPTWTSVFSEEMVRLGEQRTDLVAITAAMRGPVGLDRFAEAFPDRVFDVGIAEQHATTSAAGLALGGLHPVVAVYATFLNRAFDQVLLDVALHRCGVTFVLDRAGITGDDGASHNGMWDLSILPVVPSLRIAAPRDASQLREQLAEALAVGDAPTVLRFPKAAVGSDIPALYRVGGVDVLKSTVLGKTVPNREPVDVLIVAVGVMAATCMEVAARLESQGIHAIVVDPRWVIPVNAELIRMADRARLVVTVEDSGRTGGIGTQIAQALRDTDNDVPVRNFGVPRQFLRHAGRPELLAELGLTAQDIARAVVETVSASRGDLSESPAPQH